MITRRGFLKFLGLAPATAAIARTLPAAEPIELPTKNIVTTSVPFSYIGNGSTNGPYIHHNLGFAPSMIIVKPRSKTGDWVVLKEGEIDTSKFGIKINTDKANEVGHEYIGTVCS